MNHPGTLYSLAHYNAAGSFSSATMASIAETRGYDSRLRLNWITDGSVYTLTIPATTGYAPNSDILAANDRLNRQLGLHVRNFNRLASATQSGQPAYTDVYDRYGNRWKQLYNGACTAGSTFCATFDGEQSQQQWPAGVRRGGKRDDGQHASLRV